MKILVLVKSVARIDGDPEFDAAGAIDPDTLEWDLNEWDAFALEAALQLAEPDDGEVVAVTVGDEEAEDALLACLAKGAGRAVRVWDESLAGADALAVASVLAGVARQENPDLILGGAQSSDAANGATPTAVAGLLDLPRVAVVNDLALDGDKLTVNRELDGGAVEVLRVSLPAVITVQTGTNEPRYANLRAIKQARSKPLDVLELSELDGGVEDALALAGSSLVGLAAPERGDGASMITGSAGEVAERINQLVAEGMKG
jgi:electron transfer flavoprotein beta subunit